MKEGEEHDVEFIETGEDTPKTLESAEEPLDFVPAAVEHAVVFPRLQAVALGRHDGNPPKIQSQLAGLVVLVGTVHQQRQQIAALRGVVRLAGRERKRYRRSSIRGNQMNLGGPSTAGFADRLRTVFFNAPVPSG